MKKSGFFPYFLTARGKKFVFYSAGVATIGLTVGNFIPHTLLLDKYREIVTCYQNGTERPVPDKIKKRVEKAMDLLELRPYERKLVKPFSVFGFDMFHAGSLKYRFGTALGIPVNYNYATSSEINHTEIRFRDKPIDWSSKSGKILEEAIVLTENEQIFGICKTILQLRTQSVLWNSIFPSAAFLSVYTIGHHVNNRLNLYARPLSLRLVMYTILGLFGLGSWSFMKDFNQVKYDAEIDKHLSTLGPEMIAAGVSYYEKLLKKNMALRDIIGDNTYTAKGNVNYFLRQESLPLTLRKSFFEEKWKELTASTEEETKVLQ